MLTALIGAPVAGWKIGATAKPIMTRFGIEEPFSGPILQADVFSSPARVATADYPHLCVEAEFCYRLAKPLAPRAEPYTRADVIDAIGTILPAFEIISPRFTSLMLDWVASVIADGGLNGGIVLGPETADWRGLDLPRHPVEVRLDGRPLAQGTGAAVMGDPVAVLEWTANHARSRGLTLAAGQLVTTGATTGLHFIEPEQTIRADFSALGSVELTFSGPRPAIALQRP